MPEKVNGNELPALEHQTCQSGKSTLAIADLTKLSALVHSTCNLPLPYTTWIIPINTNFSTTSDPIISEAMEVVWGHRITAPIPFNWRWFTAFCYPQYFDVPPSVLLVQGTASGKSMVMQMTLSASAMMALLLAIMPLFALKLDQNSKITSANKDSGTIITNHLDEYHQEDNMCSNQEMLLHMQEGTETCIYLFALLYSAFFTAVLPG